MSAERRVHPAAWGAALLLHGAAGFALLAPTAAPAPGASGRLVVGLVLPDAAANAMPGQEGVPDAQEALATPAEGEARAAADGPATEVLPSPVERMLAEDLPPHAAPDMMFAAVPPSPAPATVEQALAEERPRPAAPDATTEAVPPSLPQATAEHEPLEQAPPDPPSPPAALLPPPPPAPRAATPRPAQRTPVPETAGRAGARGSASPGSAQRGAPDPEASAGEGPAVLPPGYLTTLRAILERNLRFPMVAREQGLSGTATVRFTVTRDGRVLHAALSRSSGEASLDREALALLGRVSPLPPLPADFPQQAVELVVPVVFRLR